MDLGTMYSRLESRNYYSTALQYLTDLRQMCQNAMCYNPSDTIYYQKARKVDLFHCAKFYFDKFFIFARCLPLLRSK